MVQLQRSPPDIRRIKLKNRSDYELSHTQAIDFFSKIAFASIVWDHHSDDVDLLFPEICQCV